MVIENILKKIGIALIVLSVLGSLIGLFTIDHEAYRTSQEVAEELWDNEIAQSQYAAARSTYLIEIAFVIVSLFSGVVGGLLLMAVGKIIELLVKISSKTEVEQNYVKSNNNYVDKFINGEKDESIN